MILSIFALGCDSLGITENVPVNIKCNEIGTGALMLGLTIDEGIEELCTEACLNNLMKYANSYECDASSGGLLCSCYLSEARRQKIREFESEKLQEEMDEAAWKAENPGKLSYNEVKETCTNFCDELRGFQNNPKHDYYECVCDNWDTKRFDYSGKEISKEEVQTRTEEVYESTCKEKEIKVSDNIDEYIIVETIELTSSRIRNSNYEFKIENKLPIDISIELTYDRSSEWYGVNDKDVKVEKDISAESTITFRDEKFDNNAGLPTTGEGVIENLRYDILTEEVDDFVIKEKVCG